MAASVRPHDQGFALSFIDDSWLGRGTRRTLRPQGEVCPPPRHRRAVMTKQLVRRPDDPGARVHKTRTGRTAVRRRTLRPQGEVCPPPRHRRVLPPHSGARGEVEKRWLMPLPVCGDVTRRAMSSCRRPKPPRAASVWE